MHDNNGVREEKSLNGIFPLIVNSSELGIGYSLHDGISECNDLFKLEKNLTHPYGAFGLYRLLLADLEAVMDSRYHQVSKYIETELQKAKLGNRYVAAHIRRGDATQAKMRGESIYLTVAQWIDRIAVAARLYNADSFLIMSDDLAYESAVCKALSSLFPYAPCIEATRKFLSIPDTRVAAKYITLLDEGFRLWRLGKVFGDSAVMVGSFSSNFERVVQLFRKVLLTHPDVELQLPHIYASSRTPLSV